MSFCDSWQCPRSAFAAHVVSCVYLLALVECRRRPLSRPDLPVPCQDGSTKGHALAYIEGLTQGGFFWPYTLTAGLCTRQLLKRNFLLAQPLRRTSSRWHSCPPVITRNQWEHKTDQQSVCSKIRGVLQTCEHTNNAGAPTHAHAHGKMERVIEYSIKRGVG